MMHKTCSINYGHLVDLQKKHFLQLIKWKKPFHLVKYLLTTFIFFLSFQSVLVACSMGSSTAQGVKITGVCRSPPLPDGIGRRRLAALSGLPDSATRRQIFFCSYCMIVHSSLTCFCLNKIYIMFQMIFFWKYGFCTWMVWYWAGDKPSAEPMITKFTGH